MSPFFLFPINPFIQNSTNPNFKYSTNPVFVRFTILILGVLCLPAGFLASGFFFFSIVNRQ